MIAVLGDIHFRDDKPYFVETCEHFLSWFKTWELNNASNTLILLGDLVEKAVMTGRTVDYLERFINNSSFKEIHIIVGNHDTKKQFGIEQIAYSFYENKNNIFIHNDVSIFNVEGKTVLGLPHYNGENKYRKSMDEFYSSLYLYPEFQKHFDLIVGHFNCSDVSFGFGGIDNIDKLDYSHLILGHIHIRNNNPSVYLGSVFAGKISENDNNRAAFILREDGSFYEYKLPIFNEFLDVYYPDDLPKSKALVPVYTVYNCSSESIAKDKYGEIFIRKTIKNDTAFKANNQVEMSKIYESMNIKEIMNDIFSRRPDINQNIKNICNRVVV